VDQGDKKQQTLHAGAKESALNEMKTKKNRKKKTETVRTGKTPVLLVF